MQGFSFIFPQVSIFTKILLLNFNCQPLPLRKI